MGILLLFSSWRKVSHKIRPPMLAYIHPLRVSKLYQMAAITGHSVVAPSGELIRGIKAVMVCLQCKNCVIHT